MRGVWAMLFAAVMVTGLYPAESEARRLGGARSLGVQRQAVTPQKPTPPAAAPQQAQTPQAAPAQAAPQPGAGRWLAPLAGLAAGLGLAYLFGAELGAIVMAMLLGLVAVVAITFLVRALARSRVPSAPQSLQYAGMGAETVAAPPPSQLPGGDAMPELGGRPAAQIPEGFDVPGFVRQAKKSFIALQAANDRGDLDSIRNLVTDEMFTALEQDMAARQGTAQQTDVVTLDADLLEVVTETGMHWASIRFSGMLREESGGNPSAFEEVWNLQKPEKGGAGWLLAGIQQVN